MKKLKILLASVVTAAVLTLAVSAETVNTIEQVEQLALLNSLEYKEAVLNLLNAENDLEGYIQLESSSIALSGTYSSGGVGWQTSLQLPVVEQLGISASFNQNLEASVGLFLNPLSHSTTVKESRLNYQLAAAKAESAAVSVADTAVSKYLSWAAASEDYRIMKDAADINKTLYDDEKVRYEMGEATLDDVREAFTAWSESRTDLNSSLSSLQAAETSLYAALNIDPESVELGAPDSTVIAELTEKLKNDIAIDNLSIIGNIDVYSAEIEVENLQTRLSATWLFDPDFSISGSMSFSVDEPQPELSATASISFSPDDWNSADINELEKEIEIYRQKTDQIINDEELKLSQAITAAEIGAINFELAGVELTQAEELLDEAEFLNKQGEYSEAELEETKLQYRKSELNLFKAAADYYTCLRTLSTYTD